MMSEPRLMDEPTVRAVSDYLRANFTAERVVPFVDHGVQSFRIEDIFGTLRYVLSVSDDFFGAQMLQDIPAALRDLQVAAALRQAGRSVVEVRASGVTVVHPKTGKTERISATPGPGR